MSMPRCLPKWKCPHSKKYVKTSNSRWRETVLTQRQNLCIHKRSKSGKFPATPNKRKSSLHSKLFKSTYSPYIPLLILYGGLIWLCLKFYGRLSKSTILLKISSCLDQTCIFSNLARQIPHVQYFQTSPDQFCRTSMPKSRGAIRAGVTGDGTIQVPTDGNMRNVAGPSTSASITAIPYRDSCLVT